ncbi:MAG: hypothetical protein Kow00121_53040 [Elainellaceae cyanobacterium]
MQLGILSIEPVRMTLSFLPEVQSSPFTGAYPNPSQLVADRPKFILMVQPMNLQGAIWQAILRSQQISVLWEAADVNLQGSLNHLGAAGLALPDLLLIDTRIQTFNTYAFCRWCRDRYPQLKIVLVNGAQKEVTPSEREWAVYQGASDLLPRFRKDTLVSGAVVRMRRILDLLDCPTMNQGALVAALLAVQKVAHANEPYSGNHSGNHSSNHSSNHYSDKDSL